MLFLIREPVLLFLVTILFLLLGAMSVNANSLSYTLTDIPPDGETIIIPNSSNPTNGEMFQASDIGAPQKKQLQAAKDKIDLGNIWEKDEIDAPILLRFVRGIFRSRSMKKANGNIYIRWERCGEVTPKDDLFYQALTWSKTFLASLERVKEQTGVTINPWGAFALAANESSFNECTLDFQSRKWAADNGVVRKFRLTYDRETIWRIIHSPQWKKSKRKRADFGPYQQRFSVRKLTKRRFEQLLSVHPGVYLGIREMARRAKAYRRRHRLDYFHHRPWMLWPGARASIDRINKYDKKITSVARWLGARKEEINRRYWSRSKK